MIRTQRLAEALHTVARANHYMVGITEHVTSDEIHGAKLILITEQNVSIMGTQFWNECELALDLAEQMEKEAAL